MPVESPFSAFTIAPGYAGGFSYSWEVFGGFSDPSPWTFRVQRGPSSGGPWEDVSPVLVNVVSWRAPGGENLVGKSDVLYFRLRMDTPKGTYFSSARQPYGDLGRRDFLLAREIIRRELLRARVLAGVECDVYIRSTFGPRCPRCLDPVTGVVRDTHCPKCFGTGRFPAYYGPHRMMMSFSADAAHREARTNDGTREERVFEALAIGNPVLKMGDVVIDRAQDKRYVIASVSVTSEVRRIPCLQNVSFSEAPLSDAAYRIGVAGGTDSGEGED